jgi:hypothetical protein
MVIVVTVAQAATHYSLVRRLRDVGEDVYGKFFFDGIACVPDTDFGHYDPAYPDPVNQAL